MAEPEGMSVEGARALLRRAEAAEKALDKLKGAIAWSAKGEAAFDYSDLLNLAATWKMKAEDQALHIQRLEARIADLEAALRTIANTNGAQGVLAVNVARRALKGRNADPGSHAEGAAAIQQIKEPTCSPTEGTQDADR